MVRRGEVVKVIGYTRVSTEDQVTEGVSLEAQHEKLLAYAKLYELSVVEVIEDAGVSGKTLRRPGLQRALKLLDQKKADGLLIVKLDRLTRSIVDMGHLVEKYFSEKAGKRLVAVNDQIDTKTAGGRLVLNVLVSVSQWEREAIGERTATALHHKRRQGKVYGEVPLGYKRVGKKLVAVPEELATVQEAHRLRAAGFSFSRIAERFTKEQRKTKKGGAWYSVTIAKILRLGRNEIATSKELAT